MMVVGIILWILILFWLLYLAIPTAAMVREPGSTTGYYIIWAGILFLAIMLQVEYMTHIGYARLALIINLSTITAFFSLYLGAHYARQISGGNHEHRELHNGAHRSRTAHLSGLRPLAPGTDVTPPVEDHDGVRVGE